MSLMLMAGFVFLILGSSLLVHSLKSLSYQFSLSPLFLGVVVLGFASSSPEYFVSIMASLKGSSDAAVGNIFGSNIINALLVLGLAGLFCKDSFDKQILKLDLPVLLFALFLLGIFSRDLKFSFLESLFLLTLFALYIFVLFRKKNQSFKKEDFTPLKFPLTFFFLVSGFLGLGFGSYMAIESSLFMVKSLGLTERFAGVLILSISTSLPELASSLQAVFKKEGDMALGSVVGSNIFNSLFVLDQQE